MVKSVFFRDRRIVISIEEGLLLCIGIFFGWLAGKGAPIFIILIPIALFAIFAFEYLHYKKHGKFPVSPFDKK